MQFIKYLHSLSISAPKLLALIVPDEVINCNKVRHAHKNSVSQFNVGVGHPADMEANTS